LNYLIGIFSFIKNFINGIDKSGLNVGVSIHASTDDDKRVGGFLQLGYQF